MLDTEVYTINVGPQHPAVHGGVRVEAKLDGEIMQDAIVHIGFDHRSIEKIAESRTYYQVVPYMSRMDYLASPLPTLGYCQAVEKLAHIEVPERAEYIRVIMAELARICSHNLFIATMANDLGAVTALIYFFRDRERILDMYEMTGGQRLISSYMRIGGVDGDLPEEFFPAINSFLNDMPKMFDEYNNFLTGNEIFQARLKGVGILTPEEAMDWGVTGPNLRACNIDYDIRRDDPYGIYDRFDFDVPLAQNGDCWDRFIVRLEEMEQSARIIKQALKEMPTGEVMAKVPRMIKPEKGAEAYHHIESSKGELGYYLVSDGSDKPYRLHVRAPSFVNLMVLPIICRGNKLQDLVANLATLDPVLGESDR